FPFVSSSESLPHLPSFPTRRSSDLHVEEPRAEPLAGLALEDEPAGRAGRRHLEPATEEPTAAAHRTATHQPPAQHRRALGRPGQDRKSTRLNSSHVKISYAVFCLKK